MPAYGELFILVSPKGKRSLRRLMPGQDVHGTDGVIPAASLAEADFGTEIATLQGVPYRILKPTLYDLVREGMEGKVNRMPPEVRDRMRVTLQRIVNEGCNGLICIML